MNTLKNKNECELNEVYKNYTGLTSRKGLNAILSEIRLGAVNFIYG
jgi:hypothetical protein